jgi:hypothetical protein
MRQRNGTRHRSDELRAEVREKGEGGRGEEKKQTHSA